MLAVELKLTANQDALAPVSLLGVSRNKRVTSAMSGAPESLVACEYTSLEAVGSRPLRKRIEKLQPQCHIFGHTHYGWSMDLDGAN
eukprot:570150-Amphidinium_carterae.1